MRTPRSLLALLVGFGLLAAACGGADSPGPTDAGADEANDEPEGEGEAQPDGESVAAVFPDPDWAETDPAELELDGAAFDDLAVSLEALNSNCMAVVKSGHLVAEEYWNGTDADTRQEIFSASKSVSSTLVGIAEAEGHLTLDDPASTWIEEWVGTPSETVTVRNLVSNDSGRYWDFKTDYSDMAIAALDKTAFAIGLGQAHEPGAHWEYNNSAIQTLEAVLEGATGTDVADYATEKLFEPIGMGSTIKTDSAGNPLTFMGTQASCRDLARFGYLFLREGNWAGEQIVPAEWVEAATSPSQELNPIYGYLWWLNTDSKFWADLPDDAYAALGLGNQIVLVIPSLDMVLVRLGGQPPGGGGVASQGMMVGELGNAALAATGTPPATGTSPDTEAPPSTEAPAAGSEAPAATDAPAAGS